MAEPRTGRLTAVVISTDDAFRAAVRAALARPEAGVSVELEIDVSYTEVADSHLDRMRRIEPDLAFLDLESEAHVGLKFAQYLLDAEMVRALIGAGKTDSSDLLLSAIQAGISEYVPKPVSEEDIAQAVERVLRKTGRKAEEARREPGKLLPVFAAKGGAGATSIATNLAIEIHRLTRKRTLLVDLDLELGETALLLGMEPKFSIVDLMRNFHRVDSGLLASYIERHETGVELLSAPYQPADFEAVTAERVHQVLSFLREHYDYLILDSPKTFNPATTATFEEADTLYLVTTADIPSLRNLSRSLPLLRSFGRKKVEGWIRLVVNRYDPHQVISLDEVERTIGLDVFCTLQNDYAAVMSSINTGKPAVVDGKSGFARDVRAMAARITDVQLSDASGGWLSGLLAPFRDGKSKEAGKKKSKRKVTTHE